MVDFLSFFLVLATGTAPIELTVTPPVVRVEVLLDDQRIATLNGHPWAFLCDFGPDPMPRELIAIGFDAEGRELDRAVQWINLGVQPARARLSFQEDKRGRIRTAALSWESVGQRRPESIEVTFDGEPIAAPDPRRIQLPSYDPDSMHFIGVTVRFHDGRTTRIDASFGGEHGEEMATELTALPIVLPPKARMPAPEELAAWFLKDGRPLEVQGVEKGSAHLVVVRDPAAQRRFERLAKVAIVRDRRPISAKQLRRQRKQQRPPPGDVGFSAKTYLHFLAPFATPLYARHEVIPELFVDSEPQDAGTSGLLWLAHQVPPRGFPFELAEAVSIAGRAAHASNRRRAVLVILDTPPNDTSEYSPAAVRRYLRSMRVPLYVWSTAPGSKTAWGEARYVGDDPQRPGSPDALYDAVRFLDRDLQRQRIVWLKGRHLPAEIELSDAAEGRIRLAGTADARRQEGDFETHVGAMP